MATATTEKAGSSATGNGETALAKTVPSSIAWDNIRNPVEFVRGFGRAMWASGMFGCKTQEQGEVLAMACLVERTSPIELKRKYHLIEGNLTMRADAMLADFRQRGGEHNLISRTPDEAAIELSIGKGKGATKEIFRLTFAEAAAEPFVWEKGGEKREKDGSPVPAALKKNWRTPKARQQMLWARVVSDGVRTLMPEVVAGSYTPEEISDLSGKAMGVAGVPDDGVIDAEYEPAKPVANKPEASVAGGAVESSAAVTPAASAPVSEPAPATETAPFGPVPMVTRDHLLRMASLKAELGCDNETWKTTLKKNYGVESAKELTHTDAEQFLQRLSTLAMQRRREAEWAAMNSWAERESAGNPPATEGTEDAPGN